MKMVRNYYTESMFQSCSEFSEQKAFRHFVTLNSDACVELNTPIGTIFVALEYDLSIKSPRRYKAKLKEYYQCNGIKNVIYICENRQILNLVSKTDEMICTDFNSKIYLCLNEDIQNHKGKMVFSKFNGDIFELT